MMEVRYRDMTVGELARFKKGMPTFWKRLEGFSLKLIVVFMLSFIPFLLVNELLNIDLVNQGPMLTIWIAASVGIALFLSWREEKNWYQSIQHQELVQQQVEEIHCKSSDVIMKGSADQVDFGFYFEVEEQQLLFIEGKQLRNHIEQGIFPNTNFTLVRTPNSKTFIEIHLNGEFLPPSRHLSGFTHNDYRSGDVPLDGEVLHASLNALA